MPRIVAGAVQHYAWGDPDFIPDLIGVPRDGTAWAELWFGTHHSAPASLDAPGGAPLSSLTGEMTMLVKVLACASPLSLQTHPTVEQADKGYQREDDRGIPRDHASRLYRDRSDKPEMIVAFTPFEALCGFAPVDTSVHVLGSMGWTREADALAGMGVFDYLRWAFDNSEPVDTVHAPEWLRRIAAMYPTDPGLRVAPLLNHVLLSPGEALALPAGNLHAYLHGAGLEVMKSSDNVVRAGFTAKAIDVDELLAVVDTTPLLDPIARPQGDGAWLRYPSPTSAFDVSNWSWNAGDALPVDNRTRLVLGSSGISATQSAFEVALVLAGEELIARPRPGESTSGSWWVCTQN